MRLCNALVSSGVISDDRIGRPYLPRVMIPYTTLASPLPYQSLPCVAPALGPARLSRRLRTHCKRGRTAVHVQSSLRSSPHLHSPLRPPRLITVPNHALPRLFIRASIHQSASPSVTPILASPLRSSTHLHFRGMCPRCRHPGHGHPQCHGANRISSFPPSEGAPLNCTR